MIKVYIKRQSNFPVNTNQIKKELQVFLAKKGIVSDAVVEVAVVGKAKMLKLAQDYLGEVNVLHNVFSFPTSEAKEEFITPPQDTIHLGEIILCFPKIAEEANKEGVLIDEKIVELIKHSALHLLGIHHK